jgi:hypothetical protein
MGGIGAMPHAMLDCALMIGATAGTFCTGVAAATHISKPRQAFIISSL